MRSRTCHQEMESDDERDGILLSGEDEEWILPSKNSIIRAALAIF